MDRAPSKKELAIANLHRYWVWANRVKTHMEEVFASIIERLPESKPPEASDFTLIDFFDTVMYMGIWYGLLYVVVEGWRSLSLSDPIVDPLLASPHVERLRQYRNGVFHFQRDFFDPRFTRMLESETSVDWVRELHRAFGRFFVRWYEEQFGVPWSEWRAVLEEHVSPEEIDRMVAAFASRVRSSRPARPKGDPI